MKKLSLASMLSSQGVLVALALLLLFGWLRYDNFLSLFNVTSVLRYNSMFALVALGMCFVIMSGGIDLSVGSTAALGSVVAALLSPYGAVIGTLGGLGAGLLVGLVNGFVIVRLKILPFITTLATMLAASGTALLLASDQSISVSYEGTFITVGQGDFFNVPVPALIAGLIYVAGSFLLNFTSTGRAVLAVGGNEEASRMMGWDFENGLGWISLSAYWQSVIRGVVSASRRSHKVPCLCVERRAGGTCRCHSGVTVWRGPAHRGRGLGAFCHCLCRGRRNAADTVVLVPWVRHWLVFCFSV